MFYAVKVSYLISSVLFIIVSGLLLRTDVSMLEVVSKKICILCFPSVFCVVFVLPLVVFVLLVVIVIIVRDALMEYINLLYPFPIDSHAVGRTRQERC
jgi:hypothetical protein